MPILATFVRRGIARVRPAIDPDRRRLDFASIDGEDVLEFDDDAFVIAPGVQGLDVPPRTVVIDQFPGLPGGRLRDIGTNAREVAIPLFLDGMNSVSEHLAQRARIRSFFNYRGLDYAAEEGTFDLLATQQDTTSVRRLRCAYLDGMEDSHGTQDGGDGSWSTFAVKLVAVDPYWRGKGWSTPTVSLPSANPFLAFDGAAHPLRLSSTVALGTDMPVNVPGDIASPAVIELIGPATTTHITSPSGLDVTIGSLSAGQLFVLDTGRNRAATLDGVSAWNKVGTSPKFRPLAPGGTTISIEMTGATADSRARVYGDALWESAW